MATTTNFGWETPDDTDLVKDGAAAMRTLGGAIDTSFVDLKGGTTGQILKKNTNTDMDFVWGADGTGMTLLSTTTLTGASTTVSAISQDYKQLYAVITGVSYSGSSDAFGVKPNGVTTGIDSCSMASYGTSITNVATPNSVFFINLLSTTVADTENSAVLYIDNYTSSTTNKPMMAYGQSLHVGGTRGTCLTWGGDRQNTAITSLEFFINAGGTSFTAGTVLLYGVK